MKNLRITVNGTAYDVQVEELGGSSAPVVSAPQATATPAPVAPQAAAAPAGNAGSVEVTAPMPGTVV
ncbi:MAG: acetyl-CoA carboxylase biotin carboxyl carrier protein subunit, partial [Ruminococcus sp.]